MTSERAETWREARAYVTLIEAMAMRLPPALVGWAALAGTMLPLVLTGTSCGTDSTAHASIQVKSGDADSRLLFREHTLGTSETEARWGGTTGVEVHGFSSAEGIAGVELIATEGASTRAEPRHRPRFAQASRATLTLQAPQASPEHPVAFELNFYDEVHHNRWWTVVELTDPEWQHVDVELPLLRYDRGTVPDWDDVSAWGMTFRSDATLRLRSFELWQDEGADAHIGPRELARFFPDEQRVRSAQRGAFVVMTDAPGLDLDAVLASLVQMHARTARLLPALQTPEQPVPLLVFESDAAYREFWDRFAGQVGSTARPRRKHEGYTWLGIATASYSDEYGPVRPIYVHEASHALLERGLGFDGQGSWLFEGLGNLEQLAISGQDIALVHRDGLAYAHAKMPLETMVSGRPVPHSRYWQAMLFTEWILADRSRAAALSDALPRMREQGSSDLRPLLGEVFQTDMPRLSASFWSWAWQTYSAPA